MSCEANVSSRKCNVVDDVLQGAPQALTNASLLDFWKWAFSDLCDDDVKGIFAEWIILKLLDIPGTRRVSWANSDIITPSGVRIEVKATSYWQSWKLVGVDGSPLAFPARPLVEDGKIGFHGLMANDAENVPTGTSSRQLKSDVYCFAFQHEKDALVWDAMHLSQWEFYVLPAASVSSRSISLKTLRSKCSSLDAEAFRLEANRIISSVELDRLKRMEPNA